ALADAGPARREGATRAHPLRAAGPRGPPRPPRPYVRPDGHRHDGERGPACRRRAAVAGRGFGSSPDDAHGRRKAAREAGLRRRPRHARARVRRRAHQPVRAGGVRPRALLPPRPRAGVCGLPQAGGPARRRVEHRRGDGGDDRCVVRGRLLEGRHAAHRPRGVGARGLRDQPRPRRRFHVGAPRGGPGPVVSDEGVRGDGPARHRALLRGARARAQSAQHVREALPRPAVARQQVVRVDERSDETMPRMTGGEALARQLVREGVKIVFGLPGVQLYGALAGLRDERVRFITTRHEQATTYMADGYARAGGGFGTALVVPGPGLLNAAAGLSTAYAASSPVLMLCGQVPKRNIGRDVGVLHEVNDQMDAIAPVTKWRRRVLEVSDVPGAVRAAVRQLKTGRPRPVHLEFPPDVLEEEGEATLLPPAETDRAAAPEPTIARAAQMLLAAQRPVIYAGGGAVTGDAHEALGAIAEHLQAGIATTAEGKGVISDANDLS